MCDKAIPEKFLTATYIKKCVIKLLIITLMHVPDSYKTQKIRDKDLNGSFLAFFIFLIDIKLKKFVTELFLMILFH